ncbi:unnamed protein product [Nyctereutes procyonoides]|uniref:(raccoon dog) hypothetical protein n=1 Tax=Nyctereutes procyonoides TaxID=34880 RepID=A0A811Y727_NYCPR|nr:unnamed protein product [Nyctereutes procyonoides]
MKNSGEVKRGHFVGNGFWGCDGTTGERSLDGEQNLLISCVAGDHEGDGGYGDGFMLPSALRLRRSAQMVLYLLWKLVGSEEGQINDVAPLDGSRVSIRQHTYEGWGSKTQSWLPLLRAKKRAGRSDSEILPFNFSAVLDTSIYGGPRPARPTPAAPIQVYFHTAHRAEPTFHIYLNSVVSKETVLQRQTLNSQFRIRPGLALTLHTQLELGFQSTEITQVWKWDRSSSFVTVSKAGTGYVSNLPWEPRSWLGRYSCIHST